jgi:DNA repair exonuclease SbcCD ATPase subunit
MKQIKIESMKLTNFKGVKNAYYTFDDVTIFRGDNGTGKSTIVDAFMWVMFGKNANDEKNFDVRLLINGLPIEKVETTVEVVISIQGAKKTLKKTLREKWVKKRGSEDEEFTGNETVLSIDGVPLKVGEYQDEVKMILDEDMFKLLTNPMYFNTSLSWKQRREILSKMACDVVSYSDLALVMKLAHVIDAITQGKSIERYRSQLKSDVAMYKNELSSLPVRIDEVQKGMPTPLIWGEIEKNISALRLELVVIDNDIASKHTAAASKDEEIQDKIKELRNKKSEIQNKIYALQEEDRKLLNTLNSSYNESMDKYNEIVRSVNNNIKRKDALNAEIQTIEPKLAALRDEWVKENAQTIDISLIDTDCPVCKKQLDNASEIRETALSRFNSSKIERLNDINNRGLGLKARLEDITKETASIDTTMPQNMPSRPEFTSNNTELIGQLTKESESIQSQITATQSIASNPTDISDLQSRQRAINNEINSLTASLENKKVIEQSLARIDELKAESKTISVALSKAEGLLYDVESLVKKRMDIIQDNVNSLFSFVEFKMFNQLINGGEEDTCEALIDGVPFQSANTGSKINAGLDVINAVSKFYGISAPIFLDNRESITNPIKTDAQTIHLFKDENFNSLTKTNN